MPVVALRPSARERRKERKDGKGKKEGGGGRKAPIAPPVAIYVPFESRDITAKKKPHCWGLISRWWTVGDSNPGPWD